MRLGLAANQLHHSHDDAALFRWLRACESGIRELGLACMRWGAPSMRSSAQAGWPAIPRCAVIRTAARAA
jgi:hypothetical protein